MIDTNAGQTHEHHKHHHHADGGIHQVIVNGEQKETNHDHLTFHQVCELGFPNGPFGDNVTYTVSFTYPDGTEGTMVKGESVKVKNGMIFNVGNTDKS